MRQRLWKYGRFSIFKMAATTILDFQKLDILNAHTLSPSEGHSASKGRILCRSVEPLRRYGRFNFSKWRPSAILDFQTLEILTAHTLRAPKCVIVPNFVQIGRGVVEIWLFSIFQRHPAICYTPVWTIHEVYFGGLCHCAKFGFNRCSSFDNMQVLIF